MLLVTANALGRFVSRTNYKHFTWINSLKPHNKPVGEILLSRFTEEETVMPETTCPGSRPVKGLSWLKTQIPCPLGSKPSQNSWGQFVVPFPQTTLCRPGLQYILWKVATACFWGFLLPMWGPARCHGACILHFWSYLPWCLQTDPPLVLETLFKWIRRQDFPQEIPVGCSRSALTVWVQLTCFRKRACWLKGQGSHQHLRTWNSYVKAWDRPGGGVRTDSSKVSLLKEDGDLNQEGPAHL